MAFPATYRILSHLRFLLSVLLSVIFHAALLLLLDHFGLFTPEEPPAQFEPLVVQLSTIGRTTLAEPVEEPVPRQESPPEIDEPPAPEPSKPEEAAPPEPKSSPSREPAPAPRSSVQPVEKAGPPSEAASPWGVEAPQTESVLAGDPYGDLPTRDSGGLRVVGEEAVDTSRPAEEPAPRSGSQRFFETETETSDQAEAVVAESRPATKTGDAESALPGELLDALDSSLAESGPAVARPEIVPQGSEEEEENGESVVEWDEGVRGRELLRVVNPDLSRIGKLETPVLRIYAEIEVGAAGKVSNVRILESSGITEVDSAIRVALSLWQFEEVSSEEGSIKGRVRYTITAVQTQKKD
jgi:TonB family protein